VAEGAFRRTPENGALVLAVQNPIKLLVSVRKL